MAENLRFARLTAEDCQAAFNLQLACHSHPWSEKVFRDCLTTPYFAAQLLDADNVTVGYVIGLQVLDEATLMDIGVENNRRSRGIGRKILQYFVQCCEQQQASVIWLEVRQGNLPAIHLYQSEGFEVIEVRKGYYPAEKGREDAVIMRRQLLLAGH